jgi:hypothetical protein
MQYTHECMHIVYIVIVYIVCALCIRFERTSTLTQKNINYCIMFVVICALRYSFWIRFLRTIQYYKLLYDVCCNLRAMYSFSIRLNTVNYCMFVVICVLCIFCITCFSVHHRWWVSQILASNLPIVLEHFTMRYTYRNIGQVWIIHTNQQKQEIISIDGIHIKLPTPRIG